MEVKYKDISERTEFKFGEDTLKLSYCADEEKHIYVYERYNRDNRLYCYEVIRAIRHTNPDGSIVYSYPSTEQFNSKGYFVSKNNIDNPRWGIEACIKRLQVDNTSKDNKSKSEYLFPSMLKNKRNILVLKQRGKERL